MLTESPRSIKGRLALRNYLENLDTAPTLTNYLELTSTSALKNPNPFRILFAPRPPRLPPEAPKADSDSQNDLLRNMAVTVSHSKVGLEIHSMTTESASRLAPAFFQNLRQIPQFLPPEPLPSEIRRPPLSHGKFIPSALTPNLTLTGDLNFSLERYKDSTSGQRISTLSLKTEEYGSLTLMFTDLNPIRNKSDNISRRTDPRTQSRWLAARLSKQDSPSIRSLNLLDSFFDDPDNNPFSPSLNLRNWLLTHTLSPTGSVTLRLHIPPSLMLLANPPADPRKSPATAPATTPLPP